MPYFQNKYKIESNRLENWDYSNRGMYFITVCSAGRENSFGSIKNSIMFLNQKGKIVRNEILNSIQIRDQWIFHNWIIMPNHIHLLIEITQVQRKFNYTTIRLLSQNADIEFGNLFINSSMIDEKYNSASLPLDTSNNSFLIDVTEKYSSAYLSLDALNNSSLIDIEETHCSASLPIDLMIANSENYIEKNNCKSVPDKLIRKPKSISSFVAQFKSKTTRLINSLDDKSKNSVWQTNYHDSIIRDEEEFKSVYYYISNNPKKLETDDL